MRLAAEGEAVISGSRAGGQVRGLLMDLAGHRLAPSANSDEVLQTEWLRFKQQVLRPRKSDADR